MTGPEHYRAAEACLDKVSGDDSMSLAHLAEAQVHATLALAAAAGLNDTEGGKPPEDHAAWIETASEGSRT